jgi:DtxR family Mn-dependent transcriptional regulator
VRDGPARRKDMRPMEKIDPCREPSTKLSESSLSESMEDYIEAIGHLEEKLKVVRVKNIAQALKVKMPSVSSALSVLAKKNLVNYEKYDFVELTEEGQGIARLLRRRHAVLKRFLTDVLAVDEKNAERDSCGMEHHVSKNTINNLVKFIDYIDEFPQKRRLDLQGFRSFLRETDVEADGEDGSESSA